MDKKKVAVTTLKVSGAVLLSCGSFVFGYLVGWNVCIKEVNKRLDASMKEVETKLRKWVEEDKKKRHEDLQKRIDEYLAKENKEEE